MTLNYNKYPFLKELGLEEDNLGVYCGKWFGNGSTYTSISPIDNQPIARVTQGTKEDYETAMKAMEGAVEAWQLTPAPRRGDIIRQVGEAIRAKKEPLGKLISLEMGKILKEALGEVQEFIDICEFATGLSRTFNGLVLPSERPGHFMMEAWHPLGMIGTITAFNFPLAVCGWNAAIALICGNCQIWKGATTTSLITVATTKIVSEVLVKNGVSGAVFSMICGSGSAIGDLLCNDKRLSLISFTGSTSIGRGISKAVHTRFGRTILELGGNNATIVMDDADLEMALRSVLFAAVGTCGQRCTTTRRLILHEKIYDDFLARLIKYYGKIQIGNPLDDSTLCGPLHTKNAVRDYTDGLERIQKEGGKIAYGGKVLEREGNFILPTIIEISPSAEIVKEEIFVPILHVMKCKSLDEAIQINNSVPQGLSSSIFTNSQANVFQWTGPRGSDCGIANVNTSTSGAEIGGAFGGEKETGGGRESGSDSWKQYMRRVTCTINYSKNLPLAQGINFGNDQSSATS
eukprot:TRINITY_DN852_c0_g1_i1.p1 TRINITY_DN852_c0_g1~~TRINITY_DN852_c0_g1_i1.p1  ORF type:complete len:517 (-),score=145.41 TRINITY_DN852_c0_g1_i1:67-1617(-)